jgi:hypothetical protein
VCSDEFDERDLALVAYMNDQPILVASNIEDHTVVADEVGRVVVVAHI